MKKRMRTALIGGGLLGLICVVGAYVRSGFNASPIFIRSLWYNRIIIGLVIGASWRKLDRDNALLRGEIM